MKQKSRIVTNSGLFNTGTLSEKLADPEAPTIVFSSTLWNTTQISGLFVSIHRTLLWFVKVIPHSSM